jgi:hypothetical protein
MYLHYVYPISPTHSFSVSSLSFSLRFLLSKAFPSLFSLLTVSSGRSYRGSSTGGGVFREADPAVQPAFSVRKCRLTAKLSVQVQSDGLQGLIQQALGPFTFQTFDLTILLRCYKGLTSFLAKEEQRYTRIGQATEPPDLPIQELSLFVRDFLCDRALFESFGLEKLFSQGDLSACHWLDMQQWSTKRSLDDLDRFLTAADPADQHGISPGFIRHGWVDPVLYQRWVSNYAHGIKRTANKASGGIRVSLDL